MSLQQLQHLLFRCTPADLDKAHIWKPCMEPFRAPVAEGSFTPVNFQSVKSNHQATAKLLRSTCLQALLLAGASLVGKTHMDELAYSLNGENFHYGHPVNPACPDRIPGGSSSGSVVRTGTEKIFCLLSTALVDL